DELQRIHLLTGKNLLNTEKQYNLHTLFETHKTDAISVEGWVQQEQKYPVSSILHYKIQGRIDIDILNLNSDDFVLIIMNQAQAEMKKNWLQDFMHRWNTWNLHISIAAFLSEVKGRIVDRNAENFAILPFHFQKDDCIVPGMLIKPGGKIYQK
ncbi:hypothetical protein YQE_09360, partial [Dendroctonus ponderosae]